MIVTSCDSGYLSEVETLIKSCARHAPEQRVYLRLVNAQHVSDAMLAEWHPRLIVVHGKMKFDSERWRGLLCSQRSIALKDAIRDYSESLLWLDADTIVRRPLNPLWRALRHCDLMIKDRPHLRHVGPAGTEYGSRLNSGVIAIRYSVAARLFLHTYDKLLWQHIESARPVLQHRPEYGVDVGADQELLYIARQQHADVLRFQSLPERFNDAKFGRDSAIWHGKGNARCHPLYRLESWRYRLPVLYRPIGVLSAGLIWTRDTRRKGRLSNG